MIDFMVIAGERSGSTWAANWLTTDTTICIHDPLYRWRLEELDGIYPLMERRKGISCTALQLAPRWVNAHRARKVILHRPAAEIAASWGNLVYPIPETDCRGTEDRLLEISGLHVQYRDLFDPHSARDIAKYLGVPFDLHRHIELVQMNVQPHWAAVKIEKRPVRELVERIRSVLEEPEVS